MLGEIFLRACSWQSLSDDNKKIKFYTRKDKPHTQGAGYYLEKGYGDLAMIIEKSTQRLDDIFDDNTKFDLIKMDVQGAEIDIVRGGQNLCKKASLIPPSNGATTGMCIPGLNLPCLSKVVSVI